MQITLLKSKLDTIKQYLWSRKWFDETILC